MSAKFNIDIHKTAVIVIDMQNVFCEPGQPIYVEETTGIIPKIQELTGTARQAMIPVIYLRMAVRGDGSDTGRLKDMIPSVDETLKKGSHHVEIIKELSPMEGDVIVDKPFFGGFTGTDLDTILRGRGIDTLIICGTLTNVCCETTARQAVEREYKVIFLSDANATRERPDMGWGPVSAEDIQKVTLTTLASLFCQVSPTSQIVHEIQEACTTSSSTH